MDELIRQAPIIVAIVYALVMLIRQTPAYASHATALDGYIPIVSAAAVTALTVLLVVTRDLDVDLFDVLAIVLGTGLAPSGVHEARKGAAKAISDRQE